MNYLKGLIKCKVCNKNYKHKSEKGKSIYICSGYSNYGKEFCSRRQVDEERLTELIKRQFLFHGIEYREDAQYLSKHIQSILVDENGGVTINFTHLPQVISTGTQLDFGINQRISPTAFSKIRSKKKPKSKK